MYWLRDCAISEKSPTFSRSRRIVMSPRATALSAPWIIFCCRARFELARCSSSATIAAPASSAPPAVGQLAVIWNASKARPPAPKAPATGRTRGGQAAFVNVDFPEFTAEISPS